MPIRAKIFVAITSMAGAVGFVAALLHWHSDNLLKFGCYLLVAVLASTLKVKLPGMDSTMSVHFLFVLLGVLELSLGETLVIGCTAALVQCLWKRKQHLDPIKVIFNILGLMANAICLTYFVYHSLAQYFKGSMPLVQLAVAITYFLGNTVPLAVVIALAENRSMFKIWTETYVWGLPYNLAGAALVGGISIANRYIGWQC